MELRLDKALDAAGARRHPILGCTIVFDAILLYPLSKMLESARPGIEVCGVVGFFILILLFGAAALFYLLVEAGFFAGSEQEHAFARGAEEAVRDYRAKLEGSVETGRAALDDREQSTDAGR